MMQKELLSKVDVSSIGEEISHEMAADFVNAFVEANPNEVGSFLIGRNIIEHLLAQPGCAGLRFYNAINETGSKTLVYLAIDADGKDIKKKVIVDPAGNIISSDASVADRVQGIMPTWWPF
jgi:hypothetical protein